jgi:hypothetical protein
MKVAGVVDQHRRARLRRIGGGAHVDEIAVGIAKPDARGVFLHRRVDQPRAARLQALRQGGHLGSGRPERDVMKALVLAFDEAHLILRAPGAAKGQIGAGRHRLQPHALVERTTLLEVRHRQCHMLQRSDHRLLRSRCSDKRTHLLLSGRLASNRWRSQSIR